tara:strand:+ start:104 stop:436 length:333 start_codon:yes stop_codon:yes gene_type:complete
MKSKIKSLIKNSKILENYGISEESYLSKVRIIKNENLLSILLPIDDFCAYEMMTTTTLKNTQKKFSTINQKVHKLIKSFLENSGVNSFEEEVYENGESFFISDQLINLNI